MTLLLAVLPAPYDQVELLPYDGHGWFQIENQVELNRIIDREGVHTVIEVGSWLGKSTCHIASRLPKDGKVYAVDHWQGSVEHHNGYEAKRLPTLYQQFLSNVIHKKLCEKIVPVRMASVDAAKTLTVKPDLIYIDAGHTFEDVLADLNAWYPFVEDEGILCGDDFFMPGVQEAVKLFAKEKGLTLSHGRVFWRYHIR